MGNHETKGGTHIQVLDTNETFNTWLEKPYISADLKSRLASASILIVPVEGFRGQGPCFPVKTEEIFTYLKTKLPASQQDKVEICIEKEEYKELALHADLVIIGSFIVASIILPIFTNVISTYISEHVLKPKRADNIKIRLTVVNKSGMSKQIEYEGSAQDFVGGVDEIKKLEEREDGHPGNQSLPENS